MKKFVLIPALLAALAFTGCSKGSMDMQAPSKADQLLTQMKAEPKFAEYLKLEQANVAILSKNISNSKESDSTLIRDKSKPFADTYKTLGWTGMEEMDANAKKSNAILAYLYKKYPLYMQLSPDESKQFYKKSVAYFLHIKAPKNEN
jgi:hypothetical protein